MADSFTSNINLRKPEVGAATDVWGGVAGLNGDLDLLDAIFLHTGLSTVAPPAGHPLAGVPGVGLRIGKGMVLNVEGQVQHKDPTDLTKVGVFSMDLIPTATTVALKYPPAGGTIATKEILVATLTAAHPVGTILSGYYGPTPPSGFVFLDGRTIGDATSGAVRANLDCERLFKHLWAITAQAQCPVTTSAGGASTRGATAQADWDAHKRFTLPNHSGKVAAGRDNLSGTAANILTGYTALAGSGGEQSTVLTTGHMPNHSHTNSVAISQSNHVHGLPEGRQMNCTPGGSNFVAYDPGAINAPDNTDPAAAAINAVTVTINAAGSGIAHNNIQPTVAVDVVIAL